MDNNDEPGHNSAGSEPGLFDGLPQEVVNTIIDSLDLKAINSLMMVNWATRERVDIEHLKRNPVLFFELDPSVQDELSRNPAVVSRCLEFIQARVNTENALVWLRADDKLAPMSDSNVIKQNCIAHCISVLSDDECQLQWDEMASAFGANETTPLEKVNFNYRGPTSHTAKQPPFVKFSQLIQRELLIRERNHLSSIKPQRPRFLLSRVDNMAGAISDTGKRSEKQTLRVYAY